MFMEKLKTTATAPSPAATTFSSSMMLLPVIETPTKSDGNEDLIVLNIVGESIKSVAGFAEFEDIIKNDDRGYIACQYDSIYIRLALTCMGKFQMNAICIRSLQFFSYSCYN